MIALHIGIGLVGSSSIALPVYLGGLPAKTANVAAATTIQTAAYFTGSAPLTFSATGLPSGASINAETGDIAWTPDTVGSGTITVTATNSAGSASGTVAYTTAAAIYSPTWVSLAGSSYLSGDTGAVGTDSAYWSIDFGVRNLNAMPAATNSVRSTNGRSQIRFQSNGTLLVDLYNSSNTNLARWASTSDQRVAGEWLYRVACDVTATAGVSVKKRNLLDPGSGWVTVAGAHSVGPTAGTINHARSATGPDHAICSQISSGAAGTGVGTYELAYYVETHVAQVADSYLYDGNGMMNPGNIPSPVWAFVGANISTGTNPGSGPDLTPTGTFGVVTPATTSFPQALGPGAASLGAYTSTSTPTIVRVTNRNDSGTGSLRAALTGGTDRLVIFDIGGNFILASPIVTAARITIAGETAPEPVTIQRARIQPASDTIVTGLRLRPGDDTPGQSVGSRDGITIPAAAARVMIAHNSITWAPDEAGGAYAAAGAGKPLNFTWQDNILAEGFVSAAHEDNPGERHNFGPYFSAEAAADAPTDWAFIRNLVVGFRNRGTAFRDVTRVVIAENVYYNWQNAVVEGYGLQSGALIDVRANAFRSGPQSVGSEARRIRISGANGTIGVLGNEYNGASNNTVDQGSGLASGTAQCAATYTPSLTASQAETHVLANAGAKAAGALDSIDQRIKDYTVANGPASGAGSSPTADVENFRDYDDYNANVGTAARADTNSDGIFDAFEAALSRSAGSLSPHTLINHTLLGVDAAWSGHRMSTLQTHWCRTGAMTP